MRLVILPAQLVFRMKQSQSALLRELLVLAKGLSPLGLVQALPV